MAQDSFGNRANATISLALNPGYGLNPGHALPADDFRHQGVRQDHRKARRMR